MDEELESITGMTGEVEELKVAIDEQLEWLWGHNPYNVAMALEHLSEVFWAAGEEADRLMEEDDGLS